MDLDCGADGDTARMVMILAVTGARFGQVARMLVSDVHHDVSRLMVPTSRKGRGNKTTERTAIPVGTDVIEALRPAWEGRTGSSPLLERWRHRQIAPAKWERERRGAWASASDLRRAWARIIAIANVGSDTLPYALRHSSVVRGLRAGLPTRLVAALHDTSVGMIEAHYAAFVVDAMEEVAARAVLPLTEPANPIYSQRASPRLFP
ncbi:MAG: tyrosine-type recombinase/integrase [Beijerinckiaceae bacterium]|nr:tyrosine-type recombinase/integrase [Beijerinckiaceae bacterium]